MNSQTTRPNGPVETVTAAPILNGVAKITHPTRLPHRLVTLGAKAAFLMPWVFIGGCQSRELTALELASHNGLENFAFTLLLALPSILGLLLLTLRITYRHPENQLIAERLTIVMCALALLPALDVILTMWLTPNITRYARLLNGVWLNFGAYSLLALCALISIRLLRRVIAKQAEYGLTEVSMSEFGLYKILRMFRLFNYSIAVMMIVGAILITPQANRYVNFEQSTFVTIGVISALVVVGITRLSYISEAKTKRLGEK